MSTPNFDAREFYRFSNDIVFNTTMSGGNDIGKTRQMSMRRVAETSSENWQLFEQGGRFFIRNFNTGPTLQLGIARQNQETPLMYEKSGSLTQQWVVTESNGKFLLTNAYVGKDKFLVSNSQGELKVQSVPQGSEWAIELNER